MQYPLQEAKDHILDLLQHGLDTLSLQDTSLQLDTPPEGMGDFSYPCFSLAKQAKKAPAQIATDLAETLLKQMDTSDTWITTITPTGPYVNFTLDYKKLAEEILQLSLQKQDTYGYHSSNKKRVIIEHTSANPNGPLHIGRARNPIIGDTLVRLYRACGYTVDAQYYLDDLGKQVATLAWGLHHLKESDLPPTESEKSDYRLVRYYQKTHQLMEEDETIATEVGELVKHAEQGDQNTISTIKDAYSQVLEGILASLHQINISLDSFIPESNFVSDHSVDRIIQQLNDSEHSQQEGKAAYLDLASFGVQGRNTHFYYLRSDGTSLYATRDIAYHHWKAQQADLLINILGEDHKLEARQVEIALQLTKASLLPHPVFYSFVSLPGGKMSTRRGRVVYIDDLIEEIISHSYEEVKKRRGNELTEEKMQKISQLIGIGALRYNIIKVQPEKDIVFRWEEALNFEGNAAPFICYAHARAVSILRKAPKYDNTQYSRLTHPSEHLLIKQIALLPQIIHEAAHQFKPHLITSYLFDTASRFHQFYRDCPVLIEDDTALRNARLALTEAAKIALHNGLALLGITAPEEM